MIEQIEFALAAKPYGIHLVTDEIMKHVKQLPETGLMNVFVKHTSCALCINENADSDVRRDLSMIFDRIVPERQPFYRHVLEGDDDMPSHAKSVMTGHSITIPITRSRLNLGIWQGIYLCEFRRYGGPRNIVVTIYS
jgi:secondary thiamine-phosphate synthase enzyme